MKLLLYAARQAKAAVIWATLLGVVGGAVTAWTVALLGDLLSKGVTSSSQLWQFIALAMAAPILRYISAEVLSRFSQRHLLDMSHELSARVVRSKLRSVEELGSDRLLATLTDDLSVITGMLAAMPMLIANVAVLVGCLIYVAYLSWVVFGLVALAMILGIALYMWVVKRANAWMQQARNERDALLGHYHALTDGFTELKLHRPRRETFLRDTLRSSLSTILRLNVSGLALYNFAANYNQWLFFVVVGFIVFGSPSWLGSDLSVKTSAVLALLYLRAPLEIAVNWFPNVARAEIALKKYQDVLTRLPVEHDAEDGGRPVPRFDQLDLVNVTYAYEGSEREQFGIGPINMTVRAGEIVFMTGGNGSGKTTLAKILAGLYVPATGELRVNGEAITPENRDHYRQLLSCVFAKFHLFRELLGVSRPTLDADAGEWLRRMRLQDRVKVNAGTFSTLDLSTGQRKRLALLVSMLEDRPICIFDEWASDQDPQYREEFYSHLLPELKARRKAVIVISHDDRYYTKGDRLIKLDEGQIVIDRDMRQPDTYQPGASAVGAGVELARG